MEEDYQEMANIYFDSEMVETCLQAINHFGPEYQINKTVEEMAELTKEIMKSILADRPDNDSLCEEVADCLIMLCQMTMILGPENIDKFIAYKLDRLAKRIQSKS